MLQLPTISSEDKGAWEVAFASFSSHLSLITVFLPLPPMFLIGHDHPAPLI